MSHYPSFLRSYHIKSSNSSTSNNENDENTSIKNLFFKHLSKVQQTTSIRGILGEVGNTSLPNKSTTIIQTKPKFIEHEQSITTIIDNKSMSNIQVLASTNQFIPNLIDQIEQININDKQQTLTLPNFNSRIPIEFDCDSADSHNITTASEYIVDICKYWRELEQQTAIRQNFLVNRNEGTASPQNRAVLIDWLYQVHDRFKLLSDTFHMTIQLIDRYLQSIDVSKHQLQLIGSTALLIACKYEEMTIPGMNDFVYVSDNAFAKDDMKEMERRIISTLSYELGRPLSIHFLRRYSKIVQATDIEHTLGKYILDLTFIEHSLSHMNPSYIAACTSFLSRYLFAYKRMTSSIIIANFIEMIWPNQLMFYHTNYTYEQIRSGIEQLAQLLIGQDTTKLRSVQKKFSQTHLFSIAQHSCCKSAYVQLALSRLTK